MKKDQEQPKILYKNEENNQCDEEPQTVQIPQPLNLIQGQYISVQEIKLNIMNQLNLLRFKRALAKKIIKKFNK